MSASTLTRLGAKMVIIGAGSTDGDGADITALMEKGERNEQVGEE